MSNLADKTKACPQCGNDYQITSNVQKFCCEKCARAYHKERRKRIHEEVRGCSNR